jgi:hypothetical protein
MTGVVLGYQAQCHDLDRKIQKVERHGQEAYVGRNYHAHSLASPAGPCQHMRRVAWIGEQQLADLVALSEHPRRSGD